MTDPSHHPVIHRTMTLQEWGLLLALSVLWGGSFFFAGIAIKELPPFTIVALRVSIAAIALHAILALQGMRLSTNGAVWRSFLVMGISNNVIPFSLIVWGQSHIASGLAAILNATTPLFTVVVAHLSTPDEKMSARRLLGTIIGFTGVTIMIGRTAISSIGMAPFDLLAQLACLGAAISYAIAGVYGRRFKVLGIPPLMTATGQVTCSSLILIPLMLMVDRPWHLALPEGYTIAALLGLALLSTALAYILYFKILSTAGATNLLLVTFLIPVTAIMLGVFVLGENLALQHLIGMGLIGMGLAAIDGRLWHRVRYSQNR
ncbi:MAG: DMT family transporter [Alphaproteobacteria bacterium]